jgi:hypothetical protein
MPAGQMSLPLDPVEVKPRKLSEAQLEARRAGGRARAAQFTPDYQRRALYRRNEIYGNVKLSEWGQKGWVILMRQAGFEEANTTLMQHLKSRF